MDEVFEAQTFSVDFGNLVLVQSKKVFWGVSVTETSEVIYPYFHVRVHTNHNMFVGVSAQNSLCHGRCYEIMSYFSSTD